MTCLLPHRTARAAPRDTYVCLGHRQTILDTLTEIVEISVLMPYFLEPGSSVDDGRQVKSKRVDPPAPIRLDVVAQSDLRTIQRSSDDIFPVLAVLESWARMVREEREYQPTPGPATIVGESNLLHTNVDWIITNTWVVDFASELRQARTALREAIGDRGPRPVGSCPIVYPDAGICGGRLFQDRYARLAVSCSRCGESWDETELRRLGLVIGA